MKFFLDTEFYENGSTIDLISIALVAEDGREFYAVNREARLDLVSDWLRENVLVSLPLYGHSTWMTRDAIAAELVEFVGESRGYGKNHDFWGYVSAYDWVVVCQIFGTMMNLPAFWPKHCNDLKQWSEQLGRPKHPTKPSGAHNALVDARWNRELYAALFEYQKDRERAEYGFSKERLAKACANVGIDLNCGACASQFFTGGSQYSHDCKNGSTA